MRQEELDLLKNHRRQSSVKLLGTLVQVVNCSILGGYLRHRGPTWFFAFFFLHLHFLEDKMSE